MNKRPKGRSRSRKKQSKKRKRNVTGENTSSRSERESKSSTEKEMSENETISTETDENSDLEYNFEQSTDDSEYMSATATPIYTPVNTPIHTPVNSPIRKTKNVKFSDINETFEEENQSVQHGYTFLGHDGETFQYEIFTNLTDTPGQQSQSESTEHEIPLQRAQSMTENMTDTPDLFALETDTRFIADTAANQVENLNVSFAQQSNQPSTSTQQLNIVSNQPKSKSALSLKSQPRLQTEAALGSIAELLNRSLKPQQQNTIEVETASSAEPQGVVAQQITVASSQPIVQQQATGQGAEPLVQQQANLQGDQPILQQQVIEQGAQPLVQQQANLQGDQPDVEIQNELPAIKVVWLLEKTFANARECDLFIESEATWTKANKKIRNEGIKQEYRCNKVKKRGPQCTGGIYTLSNFEPNNRQVLLFRKNLVHNHENSANQVFKLSTEVKKIITDLLDKKLKFKSIRFALRSMELDYQPRDTQIQSVIAQYRRKSYGNAKADILDFVQFYEDNKNVPDEEDKAFVVDFQRSDPGTADKWIRFFVSTKRLLKMALDAKNIHADGTYKLNSENYPIIVVGVTDKARCFHLVWLTLTKHETADDYGFTFNAIKKGMKKVYNVICEPTTMISDAAKAIYNGYKMAFTHPTIRIMCWFHVKYNVRKTKFNSQQHRQQVQEDLNKLHILHDEKLFDEGAKLFVKKWKAKELNFIQTFQNSFLKQNKNWFNGASQQQHTPMTNNALESFNASLKIHQTFWEKKSITEFKFNLLRIVSERSREYIMDKKDFETVVPVSRQIQLKGYELHQTGITFIDRQDDLQIKCYMFSSLSERVGIKDENVDEYLETNWSSFATFDVFMKAALEMHCITFDTTSNDWRDVKCTCAAYAKEYMCKHVLCILYRHNILEPPEGLPEYLQPNPKRGPKAKAKKGLGRD